MKTVSVWFVWCPVREEYRFSMHPHIYHPCPCGHSIGYGREENGHTIHEAQFRYKSGKDYEAMLDAVIADPKAYLVTKG